MTAVRIEGQECGPGAFCVPSATFPGEAWTVLWRTEGIAWCPCPGFQRRQRCRHVAEVALAIEIESRQAPTEATRAAAAARLQEIERMFA